MIKNIINSKGEIKSKETDPVCGKDFCDTCGDCLYCYAGDDCLDGGEHCWIVYVEDKVEIREVGK